MVLCCFWRYSNITFFWIQIRFSFSLLEIFPLWPITHFNRCIYFNSVYIILFPFIYYPIFNKWLGKATPFSHLAIQELLAMNTDSSKWTWNYIFYMIGVCMYRYVTCQILQMRTIPNYKEKLMYKESQCGIQVQVCKLHQQLHVDIHTWSLYIFWLSVNFKCLIQKYLQKANKMKQVVIKPMKLK